MAPDGFGGHTDGGAWHARGWPPVLVRDLAAAHATVDGVSVFIMEDTARRDWRAVSAQAAHAILHAVTGDTTLSIEKESLGKPFIPGRPLHLSISHSGAVFALALGTVDLGIDVEYLRHPTRWPAVYEWINRPEDRLPNPTADDFLRCWTAKEALVKLLGTGLNHGLDTLSLPHDASSHRHAVPRRPLAFTEVAVDGRSVWVSHLVPWKEMTVSLAMVKPQTVRTFNIIDDPCQSFIK